MQNGQIEIIFFINGLKDLLDATEIEDRKGAPHDYRAVEPESFSHLAVRQLKIVQDVEAQVYAHNSDGVGYHDVP